MPATPRGSSPSVSPVPSVTPSRPKQSSKAKCPSFNTPIHDVYPFPCATSSSLPVAKEHHLVLVLVIFVHVVATVRVAITFTVLSIFAFSVLSIFHRRGAAPFVPAPEVEHVFLLVGVVRM